MFGSVSLITPVDELNDSITGTIIIMNVPADNKHGAQRARKRRYGDRKASLGDIDDRSPVKVWSADINGQAHVRHQEHNAEWQNDVSQGRFDGDVTRNQEENLSHNTKMST